MFPLAVAADITDAIGYQDITMVTYKKIIRMGRTTMKAGLALQRQHSAIVRDKLMQHQRNIDRPPKIGCLYNSEVYRVVVAARRAAHPHPTRNTPLTIRTNSTSNNNQIGQTTQPPRRRSRAQILAAANLLEPSQRQITEFFTILHPAIHNTSTVENGIPGDVVDE